MAATYEQDLVVLVPGKDDRAALEGALRRPGALGIRPMGTWQFRIHPERDPGCRVRAHEFLRPECRRFAHALVVFDREGCGADVRVPEDIEQEVQQRLAGSGWGDRAAAVVIDPELEVWMWTQPLHLADEVAWEGGGGALRPWLEQQGFWHPQDAKPRRPKEALQHTLRACRRPRTSALYGRIAEAAGLERCTDPAFLRLKRILRRWFPAAGPV